MNEKQEERRLIFYPEIMEKEKKKFINEFFEEYNEMLKIREITPNFFG